MYSQYKCDSLSLTLINYIANRIVVQRYENNIVHSGARYEALLLATL